MTTPATACILYRRQSTKVAQPPLCARYEKTGLHAPLQVPSDQETHHALAANHSNDCPENVQAARNQLPRGLLNT
jgi:hypothetical protein